MPKHTFVKKHRASKFKVGFKDYLNLTKLEELILDDDPIDAEQVSNLLFPKGNPDIFVAFVCGS